MIKLTHFEIIKLFRRKWIWGILVFLLSVNVYNIFFVYESVNSSKTEGFVEIYDQVKGTLTDEKIDFVVSGYKELSKKVKDNEINYEYDDRYYSGYVMGDYNLFEDFYNELKYVHDNKNLDAYYYVDDTEKFIKYDFSTLLMVLISILAVTASVLEDRNDGMRIIEKCCYKGNIKIIMSKIMGVIIFSAIFVAVFAFSDIISFMIRWGIEGMSQPLCAIKSYEHTKWSGSISWFILFQYLLKLLGVIFFAIVTYIASEISKNKKVTIIIALVIYIFFIYLSVVDKEIINPILLFDNWEFWR